MKKNLVMFLILISSWLVSKGQTGRPCAEYDQNRDIEGMREILMNDSSLRASYAEAINYSVGKKIVTGRKYDMEYVIRNTVLLDVNFVITSDYLNGVRYGDNIGFTNLAGQPSDKWAAFRFNGKDYIYAKVSCMNPQKPKVPGFFVEEKEKIDLSLLPYDYGNSRQEINLNLKPLDVNNERKIKAGPVLAGIAISGSIITAGVLINQQMKPNNRNNNPPVVKPNPRVDPDNGPDGTPVPQGFIFLKFVL
jgi:hypothetical protein